LPEFVPARTITAPAGLLETESRAASVSSCSATVAFAPAVSEILRVAPENPCFLAKTVCAPGAIPVSVHRLWQSADPSNVIAAPSGVELTVNCAGTTAAAARAVLCRGPGAGEPGAGASASDA